MDNMTALRNDINSAYDRIITEINKDDCDSREQFNELYEMLKKVKLVMSGLDRLAGMGK